MLKNATRFNIAVVFGVFFLLFPLFSYSQGLQVSTLQVTHIPNPPQANRSVFFEAASYLYDINTATVSWYVNGELKQQGVGSTEFSHPLGDAGEQITVLVAMSAKDGTYAEESTTIRAADIELIWEAESYSHPFYKGKSLYPHQGDVRVVSFPFLYSSSGRQLDSDEIIFTWKKDGDLLNKDSGVGKNHVDISGDIFGKSFTVTLDAKDISETTGAQKTIQIQSTNPSALLYEHHPTLGVLFNTLLDSNVFVVNDEFTFVTYPFSFSEDRNSLSYSWNIGGSSVSQNEENKSVTVRRGEESGSSEISLNITSPGKILQQSGTSNTINF